MKIEVGDIVNTLGSRNVTVVEINDEDKVVKVESERTGSYWAFLVHCTLVKKGEKKMSEEQQLKETIEKWLNSVDVEDKECFQSVVMEIEDVLNSYIEKNVVSKGD